MRFGEIGTAFTGPPPLNEGDIWRLAQFFREQYADGALMMIAFRTAAAAKSCDWYSEQIWQEISGAIRTLESRQSMAGQPLH